LKADEAAANPASDLRRRVRKVAQPEQPKLHPHYVSKVDLRRQNMVDRPDEN
jgi:hypothetical protein